METLPVPLIGLGTWALTEEACSQAVKEALELGYRHIDTADIYGNHRVIGRAIKGWPREKLFITTKLWLEDLMPASVASACERFLKELDTTYVDLLLIHWPNSRLSMRHTLEEMHKLQERGLIKHLGVSNFTISHLEPLSNLPFPIVTNQVELHPYLQQKKLVNWCADHNIIITAYRPILKGAVNSDPLLQEIGFSYNKTAAQISLRFLVQKNIAVIPKAATSKHLKENIEIFDFTLSPEEMSQIEGLDRHQRTLVLACSEFDD